MLDFAASDRRALIDTTPRETPREIARARYGKPFSDEPGSTWQPHRVPFLNQWLARRRMEQQADVFAA